MKPETRELFEKSLDALERLESELHALSGSIIRSLMDETAPIPTGLPALAASTIKVTSKGGPKKGARKPQPAAPAPTPYVWSAVGPEGATFVEAMTRQEAEQQARAAGLTLSIAHADILEALIEKGRA